MKKLVVISLVLFVIVGSLISARSVATQRQTMSHSEWVAQSLTAIQKIKVGMTRKDLLEIFTVEGGISTRTSRTFVFRECPYIKVDVGFQPVGETADKLREHMEDKITRISKPYLEQSVVD
jgi:hypothetical protein